MKVNLSNRFRSALTALAVMPLVLAAIGVTVVVWRYHLDTERARLSEMANRVAVVMSTELRRGELALQGLLQYRDFLDLTRDRQEALLTEMVLRERIFRSAALIDANGIEQIRASNIEVVKPEALRDRSTARHFIQARETGRVQYGPTIFDQPETGPMLEVALPIVDPRENRVAAVLVAETRLRSLWKILAQLAPGDATQVYLVDEADRIIAHANPSIVLRNTQTVLRGTGQTVPGVDGNRVYWADHLINIGDREFRVIAERDWIVAARPVIGGLLVLTAVLAIALLVALYASRVATRRVVGPVIDMEKTARQIAEGDLDSRVDVKTDDELAALAQSFNRMTENLQQTLKRLNDEIMVRKGAQVDLAQTSEMLRSIIDTVPIAVFWKDRELRYQGCNAQFARDVGQDSPGGVVTRTDSDLAWKEQAESFHADDRAVMETGLPKLDFEVTFTDTQGENTWLRMSKVPLLDANNNVIGILGAFKNITEYKNAREQLGHVVEELEAKNIELERFVYTVSHELKSPLVTISGFAGMLRNDVKARDTGKVANDIQHITSAVNTMSHLLDDLLELSRIGRVVNAPEGFSLDELIQEVANDVQLYHDKGDVKISVTTNLQRIYGDKIRLREVLQNLVENAIKFRGDEATAQVEIGSRDNGEEVICYVRDNGSGIDPAYHEKIFGLFERLQPDIEGTGIGLALSHRIVELHGGRLWVESEGLGKGSIFLFAIPKTA